MAPTKTLAQREKELHLLIASPAGRAELQALASRYCAAGGRARVEHTSVITYILIHERLNGLISG